jgi:hypothetical protein
MEADKKDCISYALDRMDEIIKTYKPEPLPDKEEETIENILKEARKHYRKKELISEKEWDAYKKDLESPGYPYE